MLQPALIVEAKPVIEFSVAGAPVCQGSKVNRISGKRIKTPQGIAILNAQAYSIDQADMKTKTQPAHRLKNWREKIASLAMIAQLGCEHKLLLGPIWLQCVFVVPRSPSHYTSRGALTKSAPRIPEGDMDKMLRAVGDALTGVVYRDDKQIICFDGSTKRFSETAAGRGGVLVKVREFACWACFDTGTVQDWDRPISDWVRCSCAAGQREAER